MFDIFDDIFDDIFGTVFEYEVGSDPVLVIDFQGLGITSGSLLCNVAESELVASEAEAELVANDTAG